ncbi:hypothetical protein BKA66DRAFT_454643 [Pyrenochaeta sp. MPI-SDFR-AT-0127]|nr:hypothetical protein BKA66DRAFT_454643 [Pyrenochaeta sp. MPI-SDFR-AT-0127]
MHMSIVALLSIAVTIQGSVILPRGDGCPDLAPYRVGQPGTFWHPICCAYNLDWNYCCDLDSPAPIALGDKNIRKCTDPVFSSS